ncbi:MAG: HlyD family secretion protein [Candidatus Kapaibacteriota bacterium]
MRFFIVFLCLICLFGCKNNKDVDNIVTSGIIEATEVLVSSKVNSQILRILVDEGDDIKKGDTLATLDDGYYRYQYEQAVATEASARKQLELMKKGARREDIRQAEEGLKQAEENYLLAKTNYERFKKLKFSNSISEKQFEEAEFNFKIAQSRYLQAKENLERMEKFFRKEEIEQAEANLQRAIANVNLFKKYLSDCNIISPIDGKVLQKFVEVGEVVATGFPLFKIAKLDTMEMIVYVPETYLGKLKIGQLVEVNSDSYPNKVYKGKIVYISEEAEFTPKNLQTKDERVTMVFAVKIKIPNQNYELKSGMPADARIFFSVKTLQ